jgi:hypothetical protein
VLSHCALYAWSCHLSIGICVAMIIMCDACLSCFKKNVLYVLRHALFPLVISCIMLSIQLVSLCDEIDRLCLDQDMLWSPLVLRMLEYAKYNSFKYLMHKFRGSTHNLCLLRLIVAWVSFYSLKVENGIWARNGAIRSWVPP